MDFLLTVMSLASVLKQDIYGHININSSFAEPQWGWFFFKKVQSLICSLLVKFVQAIHEQRENKGFPMVNLWT